MNDIKSLNEWLQELGWQWKEGKEIMIKHGLTRSEADEYIRDLYLRGAITNVR